MWRIKRSTVCTSLREQRTKQSTSHFLVRQQRDSNVVLIYELKSVGMQNTLHVDPKVSFAVSYSIGKLKYFIYIINTSSICNLRLLHHFLFWNWFVILLYSYYCKLYRILNFCSPVDIFNFRILIFITKFLILNSKEKQCHTFGLSSPWLQGDLEKLSFMQIKK